MYDESKHKLCDRVSEKTGVYYTEQKNIDKMTSMSKKLVIGDGESKEFVNKMGDFACPAKRALNKY